MPAPVPDPNSKTGTTIVKSAPPKETARITVKPNLPTAAPVRPANIPSAKAAPSTVPVAALAAGAAVAAGAVAVAASGPKPVVKGAKPATTIVKTGTTKVPTPSVKPAAVASAVAAPPAVAYQEEGSTMLTTVLAGLLALVTWGTATVLFLDWYGVVLF